MRFFSYFYIYLSWTIKFSILFYSLYPYPSISIYLKFRQCLILDLIQNCTYNMRECIECHFTHNSHIIEYIVTYASLLIIFMTYKTMSLLDLHFQDPILPNYRFLTYIILLVGSKYLVYTYQWAIIM